MLTTSFTAVVLAAFAAAGSGPTSPWQTDYKSAVRMAADTKKPLAVFLGHGKNGPNYLVRDGGLGTKEVKALSEGYVSVYVDVDTDGGKSLSNSFEITEGVVISDRTGSVQAVLHEGTVSQTELNDYLTRYAEPSKVVTTTEFGGRRRPVVQYLTDPNRNRPVINAVQNVTGYFSGST
jgi:hypothetical protein